MKTHPIVLVLSFFLSTNCLAQPSPDSAKPYLAVPDLVREDIKGRVKTKIEKHFYSTVKKKDGWRPGSTLHKKFVYHYDELGFLTLIEGFMSNDTSEYETGKAILEYKDGSLYRRTFYTPDNTPASVDEYETLGQFSHLERSRETEEKQFDESYYTTNKNYKKVTLTEKFYDSLGNLSNQSDTKIAINIQGPVTTSTLTTTYANYPNIDTVIRKLTILKKDKKGNTSEILIKSSEKSEPDLIHISYAYYDE